MRAKLTALFLIALQSACSPAAPPNEAPSAAAPASPAAPPAMDAGAPDPLADSEARAATWSDVSRTAPLAGAWVYSVQHDGTNAKAVYVAGDNFAVFTWVCSFGNRHLSLVSDAELAPDQATGFGIVTPNARYIFAARSEGSGTDMPSISADVPVNDPRLDAIAASTHGFAFQVAGYSIRIPGDPMLARVLGDCRE